MFKVKQKNKPGWRHWGCTGVFIVNTKHISHPFLVFLLLLETSKCLLGHSQTSDQCNSWKKDLYRPVTFSKMTSWPLPWILVSQSRHACLQGKKMMIKVIFRVVLVHSNIQSTRGVNTHYSIQTAIIKKFSQIYSV